MSRIISGYTYNIVKRIMPKISATEKAALNSGSVSIDGDIFKGNLEFIKSTKVLKYVMKVIN